MYKSADEDAVKQGFLVSKPAISPGSNDSVFAKAAFIPPCRTQSFTQSKTESGILKRQEATLNAPPLHTGSPQMTSKSVDDWLIILICGPDLCLAFRLACRITKK